MIIRYFFISVSLILLGLKAGDVCSQGSAKADSLTALLNTGMPDTSRVILYYRLSHELQFTDIEQATLFAEKALTEAKKIRYRKGEGNALIQSGNIAQIKGNYDEAEELNLQALAILNKENDYSGAAICLNNLGIINHNRSDYGKAMTYYRLALQKNRSLNRLSGSATSLFCIGTLHENQASYDSAMIYYLEALGISEKLNDSKLKAYAMVSLANINLQMDNLLKAYDYNSKAAELYSEDKNYFGLLKVYLSLGNISEQIDSTKKAIWFYRQAALFGRTLGSQSDIANAHFSLGSIFETMHQPDTAAFYYSEALNVFNETGNRENSAMSLVALARINNSKGKYQEALKFIGQAMEIAIETGSYNALTESYREKALTMSYMKDYEGAFRYFNRYSELRDSLMGIEKQKQILELQTRYETERKENENQLLLKDKKLLQTTRNSLIISSLMLVLIAVIILRSLSIKKRDNRTLKYQKEEIEKQKEIVEIQKTSITDSIRYAHRIQSAMLPPPEVAEMIPGEHFILYLPRDIVSGDFFWISPLEEQKLLVCAADCTGHGVPGAFMSMLGMSLLSDIINRNKQGIANGAFSSADILNTLRDRVKDALRQTGREGGSRDGMDMSLCIIDYGKNILSYSGANNPVYIVEEGGLTEIKSTRNPIGIYPVETSFVSNLYEFNKGSMLYLFSDGYADQLSPAGNKFLSKNFKILLTEISHMPAGTIKEVLHQRHLDWKSDEEQIDDIVVMGIRL